MIVTKHYFSAIRSIVCCLLLMGLFGCHQKSVTQQTQKPFFFIQITDPQLGFYPDSLQKEIRNYETAVAKVNQLKPDFVVITGDLVHNERDELQLSEFKRITSLIDKKIKVYLIPGNHDVGNVPTKESIDFYKSRYKDDKFAFHHKGYYFVGINSNLVHAHTAQLEEEQYKWLENELEKGKKYTSTIVFSHHPLFLKDIEEPVAYFNVDIPTRYRYFDLFASANVSTVFAGHYHQNAFGQYKGIEMVTTSAVGEPLGKDPVGIRLVRVANGAVTHRYFDLKDVPSTY